tara:strand:- start:1089 stop:1616 length:528 start_codon:yes stop_codon:yes gene_type:complete
MSWQDILKETITQGRVKEIEDIDIDIDDDDCLRWLEKLYNIILRHPEGEVRLDQITDEEDACKVKALWEEDKINFEFEDKDEVLLVRFTEMVLKRKALNTDFRNKIGSKGGVALTLFSNPSKDERMISIDSMAWPSLTVKSANFVSKDREKISKVLKEICNYVNISYDKMTEGVL